MQKVLSFFIIMLLPLIAKAQFTVSSEEVVSAADFFSQKYLNLSSPSIAISAMPTDNVPLYEVVVDDNFRLIFSSEKYATPILMISQNCERSILNNESESGMSFFIEKYCHQILTARKSGLVLTSHPFWNEIYDADYRTENSANRSIYGPFLTTVWGQDLPNYGYGAGAAYNYFITSTSNECPGGIMEHKCLTGCVATAMAQIMKYWNYPVFRYGKSVQYDWCNMPDSLNYLLPPGIDTNSNYEIQRNAIARLMADCGEAADMHYCYMNDCQSFAWPSNARNALVDSFQYSSDAVHRLRSSYSAQTWKNFLIQDLQNGRPVLYAGASLATSDYDMSGHAFVCDGYNSGTDLFHFNWGQTTVSPAWCALDAIIVDDYNYSHLERAVFNIHPSTDDNYCDFDLQLWQHYITYYNPFQTTPPPYQNVPQTATRLYSVPVSVPDGSGNHYFDASWRTIPSGETSEYVAHKEVVLQPGFTASNGCNFTARIEPCAECESERGQLPTSVDVDERALVSQHQAVDVAFTPSLQIFPNPANSTVTLQLSDPQDEIRQITVANMQGQVMLSQTVNATTPYTLDISALPAGIYAVRVLTANGQTLTGKMVKE